MKRLPSTLGYEAIVDDADFEALSAHRWYAHNGGNGEKRPARRTSVKEGRKVLFLVHHLFPVRKGLVVDHINGDPWDNRRENLRYCTHANNLLNRKKHGGSCTNIYKGVYPLRGSTRHCAKISFRGERWMIGHFDTAEDAAVAYDAAALALHGTFARLNFPDRGTAPRHPDLIKWERRAADHGRRKSAVDRVRSGETASAVAANLNVSISTVATWARDAGVKLHRGRPRTRKDAA